MRVFFDSVDSLCFSFDDESVYFGKTRKKNCLDLEGLRAGTVGDASY